MTVAELIEELKKQRQDAKVWVLAGERGSWEASYIEVDEDGVTVAAEDCLA